MPRRRGRSAPTRLPAAGRSSGRRRARRSALLALLAATASLAGCLSLTPAQVPSDLLQGSEGNGWTFNQTTSDADARSELFGLTRYQALVYEDRGEGRGYPASIRVSTLRLLIAPSEETLRDELRGRVAAWADANGITVEEEPAEGARSLASGHESLYFVYDGTVSDDDPLFTRHAQAKILGEVWTCRNSRTSVLVVGLAQVTDVRSSGQIKIVESPDDTSWREIVADPGGTIDNVRGRSGLVYNVVC